MEPKISYRQIPVHYSAGAFIKNDKGQFLLIDRLKKPFGFACPAGHVDEGETPSEAIIREVEEETGLVVKFMLKHDTSEYTDIPQETCSRGVSIHEWSIFSVVAEGELIFKADEVKSIGWYSVEEIKELNLESAWKYWFEKILKIK